MPRLVTGLFYERAEAARAVEALRATGVASENIYLEREVDPGAEMGRKGGEVRRAEQERRIAGLETGVLIGLPLGLLAGGGVGMLMSGIAAVEMSMSGTAISSIPFANHPWVPALIGAVLGMLAGALIGWIVDYTLTRMGAGPARPLEETLVTVRTDDPSLDRIYAAMFNARARHLHVADSTPA